MSCSKLMLLLGFILGASYFGFSQGEKGSKLPAAMQQASTNAAAENTYALIIGISKYEHFPSLNFADRDARVFSEYLRSKAGPGLDSSHIFLRTNEQAKAGDIWRGVSWLERRADSIGKTAYIYFSGHGDAASLEEAYLLAHDAPNEGDPNLYNTGGTFQIYNLKSKIKKMVAKGVQVVLITDACRTNELPGKETGSRWTFQSIMEQRSGELQMTSCASNEQSLEDKKWGGGRGVFSYYLIAGLSGLADNDPEDGEVTLYELQRYIKDQVRKETKSLTTGKPRQNPLFCCEEKNEQVLAKVDEQWKKNTIASMQQFDLQKDLALNKVNVKGTASYYDSTTIRYVKSFQLCISQNRLLDKQNSAAQFLDSILIQAIPEKDKEDFTDSYIAALINAGQQTINRYTKPPIRDSSKSAINQEFFNRGASYFKKATAYCSNNAELITELTANQFFLEARAGAEEIEPVKLRAALELARRSLTLKQTGYKNQTIGLIFRRLNEFDSAYKYYYQAYQDCPDWTPVISGLRSLFKQTGKFYNVDSAIKYLKILTVKAPDPYRLWELGSAYLNSNQRDSGLVYFKKAIVLSKYDVVYANQLLSAFTMTKDTLAFLNFIKELKKEKPEKFLQKELTIGNSYQWLAFMNTKPEKKYVDSSLKWYRNSILKEPKAGAHKLIVNLFQEITSYDSMYRYAEKYYRLDTNNLESVGYLLSIANKQYEFTEDSTILQQISPLVQRVKKIRADGGALRPSILLSLADYHYAMNEIDSALYYKKIGFSKDDFAQHLYFLAMYYVKKNMDDSALVYINHCKNLARFATSPANIYNFITSIHIDRKDYISALASANESLKYMVGLHGIAENSKVNEKWDVKQKIAAIYYFMGKKDSAQILLEEFRKNEAAGNIMLSAYYTQIKDYDSSLHYTFQYLKQYEQSSKETKYLESFFYQRRLYHVAFLYHEKGNFASAMEYFKKAVLFQPNSSLNLFQWASDTEGDYSLKKLLQTPDFLALQKQVHLSKNK